MASSFSKAREPLLAIDRAARDTFLPLQDTAAVRAISWVAKLGDQPQLRTVSGGVLAAGLLRRDARMIRAGVRMLLAHELATFAKNKVKHRIDRVRPRSATGAEEQTPKPGHSHAKEDTSFPSGHSAGSIAVALALGAEYPNHRGKAVAAALGLAAGQVPKAAHYPTDVVAGLALGTAVERLSALVWRGVFGLAGR